MATKKVPSKKTAVPTKTAATPAIPTKKAAPAAKKTVAKETAVEQPMAKRINKTELVRLLAEKMTLPSRQVVTFFDLLAQMSAEQTKESGEFTIPGIGKLVKADRAARMGRNPATGESIQIKASTALKFRIAKSLKDAVLPAAK